MHNWLIYVPLAIVAIGVFWALAKHSKKEAVRQKWADEAYDDERDFIQNYRGPFWQIVETTWGSFLLQHASFAPSPEAREWTPTRGRWNPHVVWTTQSNHTSRREAQRALAERTSPKQGLVVASFDYHGRPM